MEPKKKRSNRKTSGNGQSFLSPQNTLCAEIPFSPFKISPSQSVSGQSASLTIATPTGRPWVKPRKYTEVSVMERIINDYFNLCDVNETPYTVEGIAMALKMSTESLRQYGTEEEHAPFHELVRSAKLKVQAKRVELMQSGKMNPIVGIFLLSNNSKQDYTRADVPKLNGMDEGEVRSFLIELVQPAPAENEQGNEQGG